MSKVHASLCSTSADNPALGIGSRGAQRLPSQLSRTMRGTRGGVACGSFASVAYVFNGALLPSRPS